MRARLHQADRFVLALAGLVLLAGAIARPVAHGLDERLRVADAFWGPARDPAIPATIGPTIVIDRWSGYGPDPWGRAWSDRDGGLLVHSTGPDGVDQRGAGDDVDVLLRSDVRLTIARVAAHVGLLAALSLLVLWTIARAVPAPRALDEQLADLLLVALFTAGATILLFDVLERDGLLAALVAHARIPTLRVRGEDAVLLTVGSLVLFTLLVARGVTRVRAGEPSAERPTTPVVASG